MNPKHATLILSGLAITGISLAQDPNLEPQTQEQGPTPVVGTPDPVARGVNSDTLDIRIDFGTAAGTTLVGQWNNIDNLALAGRTSGLIDFNTGSATTVSVDGLGGPWRSFVGDDLGAFLPQDWFVQPATRDAAGLSSGLSASYLFEGLPDGTYTVEAISARTTFDYQNLFVVNGVQANRTFLGTPVFTPWGSTSHGLTPSNWLIWDDVEVVGGVIVLDLSGSGTLSMLNALRISGGGEACRADIDGDGQLTIFDFLAFQNLFAAGDLRADFDGDGQLTIFDFLQFQNEFAEGCD